MKGTLSSPARQDARSDKINHVVVGMLGDADGA